MSPKETHTPPRAVRVRGDLWEAAQREAAKNGETVSDVIRRGLEAYVKKNQRKQKETGE